MQPLRAPELPIKVKGGAAIFCDPANYPHCIQAAFHDKRFAVAVGLHPRHVASLTQEKLGRYKNLVKTPRVGALGEVGLDYTAKNILRQKEVLQKILREHKDLSKPVILHLRGTRGHENRTYDTALEVILPCLDREQPIQLHCFSGGHVVLSRWQKRFPNVYASFLRLVTSFSESQKLELRGRPTDRLLLETDSPYLPTKGTKNDNTPHHIGDVAALVAEIPQEPVAAVIAAANCNFRRIFSAL